MPRDQVLEEMGAGRPGRAAAGGAVRSRARRGTMPELTSDVERLSATGEALEGLESLVRRNR